MRAPAAGASLLCLILPGASSHPVSGSTARSSSGTGCTDCVRDFLCGPFWAERAKNQHPRENRNPASGYRPLTGLLIGLGTGDQSWMALFYLKGPSLAIIFFVFSQPPWHLPRGFSWPSRAP